MIIDVACPFDTRIQEKEKEKVEKYQDLKREIKRIWQCKRVTIIPIIIGTLGTVNTNFKLWLKKLELKLSFRTMQKACLLGSARIPRKVLHTSGHGKWVDTQQTIPATTTLNAERNLNNNNNYYYYYYYY